VPPLKLTELLASYAYGVANLLADLVGGQRSSVLRQRGWRSSRDREQSVRECAVGTNWPSDTAVTFL